MGCRKKLILTFAEKCKNIMYSNWRGHLFTINPDAEGSTNTFYFTSARYTIEAGKPYIWVPEDDHTNVNYVFDDRASFTITSPFPGSLASLLQSQDKTPPRVALSGEIARFPDRMLPSLRENLKDDIMTLQNAIKGFSHSASSLLESSNNAFSMLNLKSLLDLNMVYDVYQISVRCISFIDCYGGIHDVSAEDLEDEEHKMTEYDWIPLFAAKIIDNMNLSKSRRRALTFLCCARLGVAVEDAFVLSVDRKGLDVLGFVGGTEWKEVRLCFNEEAHDVNKFCTLLANMEREAVHEIRTASRLF